MIAPAYIVKMFSNPGIRPIPIGVRRVSRRFDIFGLRHVPVPLSNILDCGNSLPLSFRDTSRVAFVCFRLRRAPAPLVTLPCPRTTPALYRVSYASISRLSYLLASSVTGFSKYGPDRFESRRFPGHKDSHFKNTTRKTYRNNC